MNKWYRACSATESVAGLDKMCCKLEELKKRELRTFVANGPTNVASFAPLEIQSRLVNNAAECDPRSPYLTEARMFVKNSRHALAEHTRYHFYICFNFSSIFCSSNLTASNLPTMVQNTFIPIPPTGRGLQTSFRTKARIYSRIIAMGLQRRLDVLSRCDYQSL